VVGADREGAGRAGRGHAQLDKESHHRGTETQREMMLRDVRMRRIYLVALIVVACASLARAQDANTIAKVHIADPNGHVVTHDIGLVHLVDGSGKDIIPPKEKDQVACSDPKISADKLTAGWLVDYENCCTSYPISLTLVLYRNGKVVQRLAPGQMIYDWHFWKNDEVAVSDGPTHNPSGPHLFLYDIRTGKLLKEWTGEYGDKPPAWGEGLQD